jgi:hypothetical protein
MAQGVKRVSSGNEESPYKRELADRIGSAFKAFNDKAKRGNEMSQTELGRLVAARTGRATPFTQVAVSGWMNTETPSAPDNPTLRAIADVLGVDLMWLAFGARQD